MIQYSVNEINVLGVHTKNEEKNESKMNGK